MSVAKAWGVLPSVWESLDEDDKALMIAFERASGTIAAYDRQVDEREKATQQMMRGKGGRR